MDKTSPPSISLPATVPNKFPAAPPARRLAIIGEAPGTPERSLARCRNGHLFSRAANRHHSAPACVFCGSGDWEAAPSPFAGYQGALLKQLLGGIGLRLEDCFLGYVSQHPAPGGEPVRLRHDGPELAQGCQQLADDLAVFQPHLALCLGSQVIRAFRGDKSPVDDWRGSAFEAAAGSPFPGLKCVATYPMDRLLKDFGLTGVCRFDFRRAADELRSDKLDIPADTIEVELDCPSLLARLREIKERRLAVAVDIEGYVEDVSCIGFATGPNTAFVVPFTKLDGSSWWQEEDELALWEAIQDVLEDPAVPKVLQNSLYDSFVLAWSYGIVIRGLRDDIMLKHFELHCELEKSLAFQTSIYTKHPYYKFERRSGDVRTQLAYCGKDCCRTMEICQHLETKLAPGQLAHYRFNMELLSPLLYMELRGIKYDRVTARRRLKRLKRWIAVLQDMVNRVAAGGRPELARFLEAARAGDRQSILPWVAAAFCRKNPKEKREVEVTKWQPMKWNGKKWVKGGKQVEELPKGALTEESALPLEGQLWWQAKVKKAEKSFPAELDSLEKIKRWCNEAQRKDLKRALALLRRTKLDRAARGRLATLLGLSVKITATGRSKDAELEDGSIERGSERDANWFLYEHCKLPFQYQKDGGKLTDKLASDEEAVIKAWLASGKEPRSRDRRALLFIRLKKTLTEVKSLKAKPDADGRIRCGYNLVGTDTHRLTCYGSPTGTSNLNLQTITKGHRKLYRADEGCFLMQRDLSGADGWTVASYAALFGDRNMLEDYRAKLKPAQIVVLLLQRGTSVNALSRDNLKPLCKPITEETHWEYFAMKRVQHGGSYKMGPRTMSDQILTDSLKKDGKPVYLAPKECEKLRDGCFFARYPGILKWHAWMEQELATKGFLLASNGFKRQFHGRKDDQATLRAALAHLPQVYTTYATVKALHRLWTDPENRTPEGGLRCEPLHTVHDSLVAQFRQADTEWAKLKLKSWFENEILIAQEKVVIPASGTYGASWGEQENEL